ncbi:hypothetical protein BN1080_01759 [Planococcus massiliensis]|uniref:Uncharacterized protein n=1 Tax=Planococcus massiliensis TaxID=1499687 RepID=A0A098EKD0_9BACL|nr:hypothetical protein [Planococcus massiliensis]CEG22824.1 hypothetical protein BN1080_01759 [Planococcus massiliensis]
MPKFICETCGVQYSESETPSAESIISNEERQYVFVAANCYFIRSVISSGIE